MNTMVMCLLIFLAMIILFFIKKIPMAYTCMGVIVALYVTGCVDKNTVFAGFGNNNVVTMASMFIVAAGLARTQMVNHLSNLLYKVNDGSFTKILASYALVTLILGQFVPSLAALFAMVCPLVQNMCKKMNISPAKMLYPIAIVTVSCSFIIEPIGPYAAWFVTQNGYLESYGWAGSPLSMWSETLVFLPTGIITFLVAIFIIPKFLPSEPEFPVLNMEEAGLLQKQEPLTPIREFLGYGVFIAVVIGLMCGLPSWAVTLAGAVVIVISGVLTEKESITAMNMPMVLLYAGVTVLGSALSMTGAAEYLGEFIKMLLGNVENSYVIGAIIFLASFIMTSLLYNKAVTTVLIPIIVLSLSSMGMDPRGCVILCSLASMSSLITPLPNPVIPMAMQTGGYSQKTILKAGLISALFRLVFGVGIAMTLFPVK